MIHSKRQKHARLAGAIFLSVSTLALGNAAAQTTSSLWGTHGESWNPHGRLPDFSYAGYNARETAIPDVAVVKNVKKDFGAKGDGVTDDTDAFIRAIAGTSNGALLIPAGRYKITKVLMIKKGHLVLRGEGPDKSILFMPKSLTDVGAEYKELAKTRWAFAGAFVWVEGEQKGKSVTKVTGAAAAGDMQLKVADASSIRVGQELRLVQSDDDQHTLIEAMQGGTPFAPDQTAYILELDGTRDVQNWMFKVRGVNGNTVTLDRPLRFDVKSAWKPQLFAHQHTIRDFGVEGLGFEFSGEKKRGHLSEEGYNAIMFRNVTNSWVRNVDVVDADYGVSARAYVYNSQFEDIKLRVSKREKDVENCHHGLNISHLSQDNLFNRFVFEPGIRCAHDITVEGYSTGNVYSNGVHTRLRLDHHRATAYANLFTNLQADDGSSMWISGGGDSRGQNGVRETVWNVTAKNRLQAPPSTKMNPEMTLVGLKGLKETKTDNRWIEATGDGGVLPLNLYESQLARRKGVYEAETATLSGAKAAIVSTRPMPRAGSHTGSGFVDFIHSSGDYVEWTIPVSETRNYALSFRYSNGGGGDRKAVVYVNGRKLNEGLVFKPTGGWNNWKNQAISASLPTGQVKVRLSTTGLGPDIDSLHIAPD